MSWIGVRPKNQIKASFGLPRDLDWSVIVSHGPICRWPLARGLILSLGCLALFVAFPHRAHGLELSYGGRLTAPSGEPITGPLDMTFRFYRDAAGGSELFAISVPSVTVVDGIFHVPLDLARDDLDRIFGDGDKTVFIEAESQGKIYPRQKFGYVPLALRVPVDGSRIVYDGQGRLTLGSGAMASMGTLPGATGTGGVEKVGDQSYATYPFTAAGKALVGATDLAAQKALLGLTALESQLNTKLSVTGGTLSGLLDMGGTQKIINLPGPTAASDATNKSYVDSTLGAHPLVLGSPSPGQVIKWDGSKFALASDQVGVSGGGIASLNNLTSSSQSLAVDTPGVTSGTRPGWTADSGTSTHTLSIPMASASGVSAGLLSKSDYDLFSGKQTAISPSSILETGAVATNLQNALDLKPYGTLSSQTGELRFRELAGNGANFVGIKAPDALAEDVIWTLPNVLGTSGQVLSTGAGGLLSWINMPSAPVTSVAGKTGVVSLTSGDISGLGTLATTSAVSGGTGGTITDNSITDADIKTGAGIADTKLATIATVGKVANSATTATSANINSAIVARDASGNFSAGTITATLSGTATNVTGTVAVANGGTGATSFTNNGVLVGSGASNLSATGAGTQYQVLRAGAGGAPAFGAINLDQAAAVTGTLPVANGGTGAIAATANQIFAAPNGSNGPPSFRAMVASDIPSLDAAKITGGTFDNARVNWAAPGTIGATTPGPGSFTSLTTSGNIGIGSSSPGAKLDVIGGGRFASQNGLELLPYGSLSGNTSELRFDELAANGTNYLGFKAPNALMSNVTWTLPSSDGTSGFVLSTNGAGTLSWISPTTGSITNITAGTGLSGGSITGTGTISLANVGTAGTYTKVTTNAQGQVTTGASLNATDIPALDASKIATGTLAVNRGGTGATTFTGNGILVGNGTSPVSATTAGTQYQVLRAGAAGVPAFGSINLDQPAAVTGALGLANGGTGANTAAAARTNLGLGTAATLNAGTAASNVVQLDANAKLPAVEGTQVTGVVKTAGDTMTGALNLPSNGIAVGTNQLVVSGGNVGIGITNPRTIVHVHGSENSISPYSNLLSTWSVPGIPDVKNANSAGISVGSFESGRWGRSRMDFLLAGPQGASNNWGLIPDIEILSLLANGNVGIGTTSPTDVLHISQGTSNYGGLRITNSGTGGNSYGLYATNSANSNLPGGFGLWDANALAYRLAVNSSGNVGIGTTAPAGLLDVNGSIKVPTGTNTVLHSDPSASGVPAYDGFRIRQDEAFLGGSKDALIIEKTDFNETIPDGGIVFANTGSSGSPVPAMTIRGSGNVGIGTTSPSSIFHIHNSGNTIQRISTGTSGNSSYTNYSDGISIALMGLDGPGFGNFSPGATMVASWTNNPVLFATNQTEKMRITAAGNVGIGTTNPSYKLHVIGNAGLSTGTAWTNASDIRLKDIDGDYEYGLNEIKRLHTVRFHYKQDNPLHLPSSHAMTGFIAQEVQEVIPDAVKKRTDGYLELNVDPIHWATVNAVQELAIENELLRQRIDQADLRADNAELKTTQAEEKADLAGEEARKAGEEARKAAARADRAEAEIKELKRLICAHNPQFPFCVR